jgi:phage shock protein E
MKRLSALIALITVALVASLSLTSCSSSGGVQTVSPQVWITQSQASGVTIVDVRTPAEYAAGHVQGAVNVDVRAADFTQQLDKLDKNGTYVVYCHSGNRSKQATDAMGAAGFAHVYNLQGGIADLQSAGAQIVAG